MDAKYASVYYDPKHPDSFGSPYALWKAVGGSLKQAKKWLEKQDTYTLHKPVRKRFPRNKIQVAGLDDQFEADLIDVQKMAKENNAYKYILTVIDSLSKFAWAIPIKNKTGDVMVSALSSVFKQRRPRKLRTDRGKEFLNHKVQQLLKEQNILFFTSNNETKAAIVERFNRTLQSKLHRYFTASKSHRYVDVLPSIVTAYNNRKHSTTGVAPAKVNVYNAEKVWRKVYHYLPHKVKITPLYKKGDHVRISKSKGTFEKGYKTNWRTEIFVVKKVFRKKYPEYELQDLTGEEILGKFSQYELQRVEKDPNFIVERVVKKRGNEALVEWKGYPPTLKTWIPITSLTQYQRNGDGLA